MQNIIQATAGLADTHSVATQSGANSVITLPAPGERQRWVIVSHTISINAAPSTQPTFTIVSGATTLERIDFPNVAVAPYSSRAAFRGGVNEGVTVTLTSCGAGVTGTISVRAVKVAASAA